MSKFVPGTNMAIIICLCCLCTSLYYLKQDDAAFAVMGALLMFIKSD